MPPKTRFLATAACLLLSAPIFAQGSRQPVPALAARYVGASADSLLLVVSVELAPGWSINSHAPLDSFLIPTRLEVSSPGADFGEPRYPEPVLEHSAAIGGNLSLFRGAFEIRIPGKRRGRSRGGKPPPPARVALHYQSCDGQMCFPPKQVEIDVK